MYREMNTFSCVCFVVVLQSQRSIFSFYRTAYMNALYKKALKEFVENDDYYKNMDEAAFDVAVQYTNATQLIEAKEYYEKGGSVNMCQALTELIEDGRMEGMQQGMQQGMDLTKKVYKAYIDGKTNEIIAQECNRIRFIIK